MHPVDDAPQIDPEHALPALKQSWSPPPIGTQTCFGKHSQKQYCGTIPSAPVDADAAVRYLTPTAASVVSAVKPGKLTFALRPR